MGFFSTFSPLNLISNPPLPPFTPAPVKSTLQKATNFLTAPIKSTIAADPLLSWAQTGRWSSHAARTKAGVHELYKEDRLAQRLGVREKDVVTVVHVVTVVVAIYFGGSFLSSGTSGSGATAAGTGTTAAGTGVTVSGVVEGIGAVGTVAGMVAKKPGSPAGEVIGGEVVANESPEELAARAEREKPTATSAGGLGLAGTIIALGALIF